MITISQLKTRSISKLSELLGINIVKLSGKRKSNYFIADDGGIIVGFLGKTRQEVSKSLLSCFAADELGVGRVPQEQKATHFMYAGFELDDIQDGKYRSDLTGHESICDYVRECYINTFIGEINE